MVEGRWIGRGELFESEGGEESEAEERAANVESTIVTTNRELDDIVRVGNSVEDAMERERGVSGRVNP